MYWIKSNNLLWQLCAAMMSWDRQWVELVVYYSELFILFAENSQILLKISHSLNFHVSGNLEFVSKQPTQLIIKLNSSLRHIIVTMSFRYLFRIIALILNHIQVECQGSFNYKYSCHWIGQILNTNDGSLVKVSVKSVS